jgi:hypothetical protein
MTRKMAVIAPLAIIAMIAFIIVGGEVVALLWNWLLPPLFGFPQVTFWQALGLLVLARILFGRLGGHSNRPYFRRRLRADERERLQEGMRGYCGGGSGNQSQQQFE